MRFLISVALLAGTALAPAARADFVITGTPPPVAEAPAAAPSPPPGDRRGDGADTPRPPPPRFSMAAGFGDQVPLAFACRQIVPRAVRVVYGPGADPRARVDWKGGDTWNHVLAAAVKPLGLRLVMTTMAVEIRG
jgi:hypothetical protein